MSAATSSTPTCWRSFGTHGDREGRHQQGGRAMIETTVVTRTVPGVDQEQRARLVVGLNASLAGLTDLAAAYKQAHWNVVGSDFSQLHELFDQFSDQTRAYMDVIAER